MSKLPCKAKHTTMIDISNIELYYYFSFIKKRIDERSERGLTKPGKVVVNHSEAN
jgi:hypothetical protein